MEKRPSPEVKIVETEEFKKYKEATLGTEATGLTDEELKRVDVIISQLFRAEAFIQKSRFIVQRILARKKDDTKMSFCFIPLLVEALKLSKVKIKKTELKNVVYVLIMYMIAVYVPDPEDKEVLTDLLITGFDYLWHLFSYPLDKMLSGGFCCCTKQPTTTMTEDYLDE